ncbi:hypothetical protein [Streptomyces sp. YIM S03343]
MSQARAPAPQRAEAVGDLGRRQRRLARSLVVGLAVLWSARLCPADSTAHTEPNVAKVAT